MSKSVLPMPQSQADKLIGARLQPAARHFNGQGVALPSAYLPLSGEDFSLDFQALWEAHVNFGTSRSHKKLLGKKRQRDGDEPKQQQHQGGGSSSKPGNSNKRPKASSESSAPASSHATASITSVRPTPVSDAQPLTNKGRFAGTLAARLLGGGGPTGS